MLQRVLLAYARWNKQVGYCQGFNVIAALILDVMDRQEDSALKVSVNVVNLFAKKKRG
jgi:Rab-GTPase-TBC domain